MNENNLLKIGITHGDYNSIAYEVIIKALADNKIMELCTPIVYGMSKVATFYRKMLEQSDFSFQFIKTAAQPSLKRPNLINIADGEVKIEVGTATESAGKMAELALNLACKDLKTSNIDAVVTAPINKSNIQSETFKFNGHTEFFAAQFKTQNALMMMVTDHLKLGFVTNHLPIESVTKSINEALILQKINILHQSLKQDFAMTNPKIAVLSLNPHAGDNGLLGKTENEVIIPAIGKAFEKKVNVFGPFPADGFFASGNFRQFDAVLAMYHDQGMIPFKLLASDGGVNFTAGLPIVRTSPAHGTAYDIAGKNQADAQSLRNAIYLAIDIVRNRKNLKS